jgi:hypothetical protein
VNVGTLQAFLAVEAVAFAVASLIHGGHVIPGYAHRNAHIAEAILAIVLFAGLAVTVVAPDHSRRAGLLSQGFALLGTLVGLFTIAVGVGPRTLPDVIYHVLIIIVLASGLYYTRRAAALRPTG